MSKPSAPTLSEARHLPAQSTTEPARRSADRPIAAVLADIVGNVQDIVRSELRLATVELQAQAVHAGRSGGLMAAAAVFGLYALGLLLALAVLLLARVLDVWLATLVVLVAVTLVGGTLALLGMLHWRKVHLKPEKTVETVKENVSWLKAQTK